ncbi:hypothetical protein [Thermoactinospora rubra]|uniref:hypothetical protein n=1 Tax=Thermoactinospora rubra TaxID=1088767 RepID=UPI000A10AB2E|nr:hypothetical protein [Thermoactinospora rubra]
MTVPVDGQAVPWDLGPVRPRRPIVLRWTAGVLAAVAAAWILRPSSCGEPVALPQPSGHHGEAGYPVGFPHTGPGAAAAAAAALEAGWSLDAEEAAAGSALYVAPDQQARSRADAASATVHWRRAVGLPDDGGLPSGAALTVTTIGVRWQERSRDQVVVSVLARVDATAGDAGPVHAGSHARTFVMTWSPAQRGGDWVRSLTAPPAAPPPVAEPGSPAFASAGWRPIARGHS